MKYALNIEFLDNKAFVSMEDLRSLFLGSIKPDNNKVQNFIFESFANYLTELEEQAKKQTESQHEAISDHSITIS